MHFSIRNALSGLQVLFALSTITTVTATDDELQKVLQSQSSRIASVNPRQLHGRFLHISDIHPDPFYDRNASVLKPTVCHRGHGRAGKFGAETSDCDSPFELAQATFKWIKKNIKDKIDFVIWTGDNARHDNDNHHPRTEKSIYKLNEQMIELMTETFHKHENEDDDDPTNDFVVPIVPTIGNNDIFPHNVFMPGPSAVTRKYLDLWRTFVPEEEHHIFERGAYFMTEVIPNRLAVFSLNTMYFFRSNGAVDGCKKHSEPGYAQFEWLRIQLELIRQRKMKAILIGHVPPAWTRGKKNWEKSCWDKFAVWTYKYRDIIVTSIFGHMNIDHFILTDTKGPLKKLKSKGFDSAGIMEDDPDGEITIYSPESYLTDLREVYSHVVMPAKLPKTPASDLDEDDDDGDDGEEETEGGGFLDKLSQSLPPFLNLVSAKDKDIYGTRYTVSFVGPSVIPNFFPTLRVMEYNIEGLTNSESYPLPAPPLGAKAKREIKETSKQMLDLQVLLDEIKKHSRKSKSAKAAALEQFNDKNNKKPKKKPHDIPRGPPKGAGLGPAYKVQPFTLMGYTQYFCNLTHINGWVPHEKGESKSRKGKKKGKNEDPKPDPNDSNETREPPEDFEFEVEYHTSDKPYNFKDLTVRNYMLLANQVSEGIKKNVKSQEMCKGPLEFIDYEAGRGPLTMRTSSRIARYSPLTDPSICAKAEAKEIAAAASDSQDENDIHAEVKKKGNKNKGDKKKKKKQKKMDRMWHTFYKRAVVQTISDKELRKMDRKIWPRVANGNDN